MRKVVLALALMIGLNGFSQRRPQHHEMRGLEKMTVEQVATLHTKKMTLALELNETQQEQIFKINVAQAEFRKAKMDQRPDKDKGQLSGDALFELQNERLDHQLAYQQQLKEILTIEQYEQWKKTNHDRMKKRMTHRAARKG